MYNYIEALKIEMLLKQKRRTVQWVYLVLVGMTQKSNKRKDLKMKTEKNYSPKTRILSLILSFLIVFYLVPASAYAEELDGGTSASSSNANANEENNCYYDISGLEDYYSLSSRTVAGIGSAAVNLATGSLTFVCDLVSSTDYLMPMTVSLIYNSDMAGKDYDINNSLSAYTASYMPYGFRLNISETIIQKTMIGEDGVETNYCVLLDTDGTNHYFYYKPSEGYVDDSALGRTLEITDTNDIEITYKNQSKKTFTRMSSTPVGTTGGWILKRITDKYGNSVEISLDSAYKPRKISLYPNGNTIGIDMFTFDYYAGKLSRIKSPNNSDFVAFAYSSTYDSTSVSSVGRYLRKLSYGNSNANGAYLIADINYYSNGNVKSVYNNATQTETLYSWANDKVTLISEYAVTELGQEVSYSYGDGYTDMRSTGNDETLYTDDDIITRYIFDGYGRTISAFSMSSDGEEMYGATTGSYDDSEKSKNSIKCEIVLNGVDPENIIKNTSGTDNLVVNIQGGTGTTEDSGYYKQIIYEAENVATLTESNANMEFILSGFGMASSITQDESADFSLGVNVYYYQGLGVDDAVVEYRFDFADIENVWQYVCGKFYCRKESTEETNYDYVSKIELVCTYFGYADMDSDVAYASFKDIALTDFTDSGGYDYTYNPDSGNLEGIENSLYQEFYVYDEENRIVHVENIYGDICDYTYTEVDGKTIQEERYYKNHDFTSVNTFVYDSYGLLISSDYSGVDNPSADDVDESLSSIITVYEYITDPESKIFGALSCETNSLGHPTKYFYDESNGNLLAQINVDSRTGYAYEYSEIGELEAVWPAYGTASSYSEITNAESVKYDYDPITHRLSKITTASTEYSFSYDSFGNSEEINVGDNSLATYEYYPNNGKIKKINYGNGFSEEYVYNTLEMLSEVWYTYDDGTSEMVYEYTYNANGLLSMFEDIRTDKVIEYTYDNNGRLEFVAEKNGTTDAIIAKSGVSYDDEGRLNFKHVYVKYDIMLGVPPLIGPASTYEYGENGLIEAESHSLGNLEVGYHYDNLNRLSRVTRVCGDYPTFDYVTEYSYLDAYHYGTGDNSSYLIGTYASTVDSNTTTYSYGYDPRGNITSINKNGDQTIYTYDDLGQLLKESDGTTSRTYTYDNAGNIISIVAEPVSSGGGMIIRAVLPPPGLVPISPTTTTFSYTDSEWGDLLTAYNGHAITYDEIGNPLTYYNGSAYTFTWEGRRLVGATKGSKTMSFTYDDNGIRTSKTVNGVKHTYHLNGSQIIAEEWNGALIIYLYDTAGSPIGMMYRTASYNVNVFDVFYFEKNLQGDIVAVYDETGTKVATYNYTDAWGNHTASYTNGGASTGAAYNPFRYRGYYYDTDLGMYYLQSRYYDAKICRFINADGYVFTGQGLTGYNMFAYCGNNPVMYTDAFGNFRSHVMVCSMDDAGSASTRYSYSGGNILIVNGSTFTKETKAFFAQTYSNTIIVFDERYCESDCQECNPNMQIYNSYIITSEARQREILEILVKHDEAYPSRHTWGRTVESMLIEWDAHNDVCSAATILKALRYNISQENLDRVMHTDFDYKDEKTTYKQYWDRVFEGVF